jgi:6-phosphogluconolactonase
MVFSYSKGKLRKVDQTTILANGFKGTFTGADIHFSWRKIFICLKPWGRNTISTFRILKNGKLESKGQTSSLGKDHGILQLTQLEILVAHQYTNDIVIFKRNKSTGALTDSGKRIELCLVCLVFTENN